MHIPEKGLPKEQVLQLLEAYKQYDFNWRSGKIFGYVYDPGQEALEMTKDAYMMYLTENGLDPTVFPSLLKLETEVVRMIINLLRGDENVVGNMTTGGTESIMLAIKTIRDKCRAERPHIRQPEMVLPLSAHAAFHKAAHYFDIKKVITPINTTTFQADVEAMHQAITENTILLVASAPCYSQGVVDPIPEIGQLALEHNLFFHVDACVGGIHLSFMRELGYPVPPFDWTVPGVTSISADMHKYGYAAKGSSVIMYRNKDIRRYQLFACSDSTSYTLINTTLLSTKTGGPMAGSWAILNFLGKEGYGKIVREVQEATQQLIEGINSTGELRVLGKPDMCMFSFTSESIDLLLLADEMRSRGWFLQPQFSTSLTPLNLHISVNHGTVRNVPIFLKDLRECIEIVKQLPPLDVSALKANLDQFLQKMPPDMMEQITAMAGIQGANLPEKMAPINAILEALPDPLANMLLVEYFNLLFV